MADTLSPLDIEAELKRRGLSAGAQAATPQQPVIPSQLPVNPAQQPVPDQSAVPQNDIMNEMLRRGIDPKLAQVSTASSMQPQQTIAAVTPQQPAVDPGFLSRYEQTAYQHVTGKNAPPLTPNAGIGSRIGNALGSANDYLGSLSDTILHGLSFGTSDELGALTGALNPNNNPGQSFGERFQSQDKLENQNLANFKQANPIAGNAAEITGMIVSPIGNVGGNFIMRGGNMATRAARAAAVGGALGAGSGAANAEGDLNNRAKSALFGGTTGAVLGGTLTPALELLTRGGQIAYNTIANQVRAARDPESQAQRLLANAMLRDQQTVPNAITAVSQSPDLGLVNAGGQNVAALGRQATVAPGNARTQAADFFEQQAAGMPDRSADAVRNLAQNGYYGTLQQLDTARRTAAAPLYERAYQQPSVDQWSPELANLMQRPSMRDAAGRAARIAAEEGRNPAELGLTFNAAGDPVFVAGANANGQIPSVQTMDYMKRGLDDVLEQFRDPTSGRLNLDTAGRAAQNTRAQFVQMLRQGNPNYAAALDAWGGPSHSIEMMNFGRDLWRRTGDPAELLQRFQQLPANDQEMVRTGLMREAINKIGNLGDNSSVYQALFGNSNKRAVFEQVFPTPQAFDAFAGAMRRERDLLRTNRMIMGGSPTASRMAENADAMQQLQDRLGIMRQILTGHPLQAIGTAVTRAGNAQRGMSEPVADALGRILFNPNQGQNVTTLQNLLGNAQTPGVLQLLQRQQLANQSFGRAGLGLLSNLTAQPAGLLGAAITRGSN